MIACGVIILSLAGCTEQTADNSLYTNIMETVTGSILSEIMDNVDEYEIGSTTKQQEIRVYSGTVNGGVRTITDTDTLREYMQNTILLIVQEAVRPRKLSAIPNNATELYRYELWQKDIESSLMSGNQPLLKAYSTVLYQNADKYYLAITLSDNMAEEMADYFENREIYVALSDPVGTYLVNMAQGNLPSSGSKNNNANGQQEDGTEFSASYLAARSDVDYDGVANVSRNQKIDIVPGDKSEPTFSITDLQDIVDFLKYQRADKWRYVKKIPSDAEKICDIIRYAQARRTGGKKLTEQYRDVLYTDSTGYYIEVVIGDNGLNQSPNDLAALRFKIPNNVGIYLESYCK